NSWGQRAQRLAIGLAVLFLVLFVLVPVEQAANALLDGLAGFLFGAVGGRGGAGGGLRRVPRAAERAFDPLLCLRLEALGLPLDHAAGVLQQGVGVGDDLGDDLPRLARQG